MMRVFVSSFLQLRNHLHLRLDYQLLGSLRLLLPIGENDHQPDKAVTVDTNLMVHPSCITAAETLLVSSNPQPLLHPPSLRTTLR